jgi:uncharacterized protein YxjI
MRYLLRQRLFVIGTDFVIQNQAGQPAYYVDGKIFRLRETLEFQDINRRPLAQIVRKWFALTPSYEIHYPKQGVTSVSKAMFTLFRCKFSIDIPGPNDLEAQGDFWDYNYTFYRRNKLVAHVSRKWFALTDSYGVDVVDGEDALTILASTVIIDLICHDEKATHHQHHPGDPLD